MKETLKPHGHDSVEERPGIFMQRVSDGVSPEERMFYGHASVLDGGLGQKMSTVRDGVVS